MPARKGLEASASHGIGVKASSSQEVGVGASASHGAEVRASATNGVGVGVGVPYIA